MGRRVSQFCNLLKGDIESISVGQLFKTVKSVVVSITVAQFCKVL